MDILMHICCGPCGVAYLQGIIKEGFCPVLLWENPNIHPYKEYEERKQGAIKLAELWELKIALIGGYGLEEFVKNTAINIPARCAYCYSVRMEQTAAYAAKNGYKAFSTTLLASPYQNFDAICRYGKSQASLYNIEFVIRDFRQDFRQALNMARSMGIYMQKYCGCIFSEEERYRKK